MGPDAPYGFQVLGDRSKAKIRQACMTSGVHKDIWLVGCQCGGETRFRTTTYTLEISMNNIAGVEVVEALSDVGQLVTGVSMG
jgi:hypothetical protein